MDQLKAVRTFIKEEFVDGTDYGKIPGCGDKPALLLPGAQKATMYFNCFPTFKVKETKSPNGHYDVRVRCILISRATGKQAGEGIGCCSTMEKKYRWRKAERKCPKCGASAIINGKAEYGGGFICYNKKGGCGAKFADNAPAITSQPQGQVENDEIFDLHNTVLKMAKKRAHVDASITLACLSELFTQDIEDTFDIRDVREQGLVVDGEVMAKAEHQVHTVGAAKPATQKFPHQGGSGRTGSYASKGQTDAYLAYLKNFVDGDDGWVVHWSESWLNANERDGVPNGFPNCPFTTYQMTSHLLKTAIAEGKLKPVDMVLDPNTGKPVEKASTMQRAQMVAIVFDKDREWAMKEMARYAIQCAIEKSAEEIRKSPSLTLPEAFQPEPQHGDAYEGPYE
jgi:hypothetical protein